MNEQEQPLECLFRLMRGLRRGHSHHHGPHHSHGYGRLMDSIAQQEGASARELTELLDIRPSSLSEMLSKLESQGDIRRQRDEKDARISRVWLTEQGRQRLQQHRKSPLPYQSALMDCLTAEEIRELNRICQKLTDRLAEEQSREKREEGSPCRQEDQEECTDQTGF
ncbi:MAG: MarR family transcriptional regulator [Oscillospiraceae bacterium]|nr:MarR family transcriptional regulator [Oscillospiraceae bacterium]